METTFKPEITGHTIELVEKKKSHKNYITGERSETVETREQLKHVKGEYKIELFNEAGEKIEEVIAENATPLIYSQYGTTSTLEKLGLQSRLGKNSWGSFSPDRFFDDGMIFLTKEGTTQVESTLGAIPSGKPIAFSTLNQAYTGDLATAGTFNESKSSVEAGIQNSTLTYVVDFTLEKGNGTFDTAWLGYWGSGRYDNNYKEMSQKVNGHFKLVDDLSPTYKKMDHGMTFARYTDYPDFYPLNNGYTYFGQTYYNDRTDTPNAFYLYDFNPDDNDFIFQRFDDLLDGSFNTCEEGGAGVYLNHPAILKRKAVATNIHEFVYFTMKKDIAYTLIDPVVVKLRTESLPNHEDLRLIGIKSFEDVLYAFFKPKGTAEGKGIAYVVNYTPDGQTYRSHTTINYGEGTNVINQDEYRLKNFIDVYRLNNVDHLILGHSNSLTTQYASVYSTALSNENKVITSFDNLSAFPNAIGDNTSLWKQIQPNSLFFSQSTTSENGQIRLYALMVPFSHTKINTITKDVSQSMRLTYTLKLYHNVSAQYLGEKPDLNQAIAIPATVEAAGFMSRIKTAYQVLKG